jgi:hypothetical protein
MSGREKANAWQRAFRKTPAGKLHTKKMNLRTLGCSWEQFQALMYCQGGLCAVCFQPELGENQHGRMALAVDHNHETGKIRGLLCHRCNRALGLLQDDADRVQNLAAYRRRF